MRIGAGSRVARALAMTFMLCLCCARSLALDPALDASQYAHTAWKIREGFSRSLITAVAQTPDGYLWLGTQSGLLRFDGVRNVPWQPPPGASIPDEHIRALLVGRNGTLWIGTEQGVASWREGALLTYPQLNAKFVTGLVEDRDGTIWVGAVSVPGNGWLCTIQQARTECQGEDGRFQGAAVHLYEDSRGVLWVAAGHDLWQWTPGPPVRHSLPEPVLTARRALSEDATGALLISTSPGVRRFIDGKVEAFALPRKVPHGQALSILRDRDGALWMGTAGDGLIHIHQGRADVYGRTQGLSGDWVNNLFEDREGNVWTQTIDGIDRFRAVPVTTYSVAQGLPGSVYSVLADRDESIWLKTSAGLYRLHGDEIRAVFPSAGRGVDSGAGHSLFQDRDGRIWMGAAESGFGYLENGRLVRIADMPPGIIDAMAQDNHGDLWIGHRDAGLLRLSPDRRIHRVSWTETYQKGRGLFWRMTVDPVHGGLWIGRYRRLVHLVEGEVRASYDLTDKLANARIHDLRVAADGTLWVASEGALLRIKDGRIATLDRAGGLPCDEVDSTIEDDRGSLWILSPCGIATVAAADLEAWAASIDAARAPQPIQATTLDGTPGMQNLRRRPFGPHVARSRDGRLWFAGYEGAMVVDPRHLPLPKPAPRVLVEQIAADRKAYGLSPRLRLPPLVRDLQIDYTAPNLTEPEKIAFRYRLEGYDRDWRDAGSRRQAIYSDLRPGDYRFHVVASNNSAVWPEEGAAFDFSIAPAYWQTWWFRTLCVAALLASLWTLYRRRVRHLARQFNMTLEARVAERTRIARELHDTLLQSFHGLLMRFQTAHELLPGRPAEAKQLLASSIEQAAEAITEGRDAVQGLRASTMESNDLAAAIRTLGEELAAEGGGDPVLRVEVQGEPRSLHPILRDETFRIVAEALRNAYSHAEAEQIEVELRYDEGYLRLRVRDDGKGIDRAVLSEGGREGHFGLRGMHERATLIGGKLTVWSAPGSGTEVELSIPASHAYAASS
jgi:signal transduction histidine kinase/ligand-binding sensor domain-containing protein